jgi:hypothetical protein
MADENGPQQTPVPGFVMAIQEFYADAAAFEISPYTFSLNLGVSMGGGGARPVATVRMSHAHAKVMAIMLKRFLKEAEEKLEVPIAIAPKLLEERKIDLDRDW